MQGNDISSGVLMDINNETVLDKLEAIVDESMDLLLADVERVNKEDTTDFLSFASTEELAEHLGVKWSRRKMSLL